VIALPSGQRVLWEADDVPYNEWRRSRTPPWLPWALVGVLVGVIVVMFAVR